jgi:cobalt transporter subunit CbtB
MASIPNVARAASTASRLAAALCAAFLGLALVYLAGFAPAHAIHDGAHDTRHAANFPCH